MDSRILFQELVKGGFLNEATAEKTLKEAALTKKNAEELLLDRRLTPDEKLAEVKSRLLGIPYKAVDVSAIPSDLIKIVPEENVRNYKIVPLSKSPDMLVFGMVNPDDEGAQQVLKFIAKQQRANLGVYLITYADWQAALRHYSPFETEVESAVKSLKLKGESEHPSQRIIKLEEGVAVSEEAPIIKIVASALKEAVFEKASDIHIEPQRNVVRIRFRIDGDLRSVSSLPIELHQPIVSRVKVLANLKLDETRIPQDGRFRTVLLGRDIDFRVSTFPTAVGEKAAIRVLDPTVGLKGLESLGLLPENRKLIEAGIENPYGMILLTGPTGSGKTTTLYAIMQLLNKEDVNIVSLEDPVEYFIEGLNQSQVRPEIGYDFASGLRQILRQDPDIIMVGEIRDEETAGLAVHSALTGHIVLSTLHTNNSLGVIPRLIDMKVEPFLLPSSLNLMLAQRLVSKLCEKCRKPEKAPLEIQEIIKKELSRFLPNPSDLIEKSRILDFVPSTLSETKSGETGNFKIYHASGCDTCKGKGISGRIALFEVFRMTPELGEIITSGPTENKIREEAKRQGMIGLRQDGILKALQGIVSIEEVLKETSGSY